MLWGVDTRWANAAFIALVVLCRVFELKRSERNAAWSLARGGVEHGRGHYPAMVGLHVAFLAGCAWEPFLRQTTVIPWVSALALATAVLCQGLRWWIIQTLGTQWNIRVIVVPGASRVNKGLYQWLSHPNYVVVALEGLALPAVHAAWITAGLFLVFNAALMVVRLRVENRALESLAKVTS